MRFIRQLSTKVHLSTDSLLERHGPSLTNPFTSSPQPRFGKGQKDQHLLQVDRDAACIIELFRSPRFISRKRAVARGQVEATLQSLIPSLSVKDVSMSAYSFDILDTSTEFAIEDDSTFSLSPSLVAKALMKASYSGAFYQLSAASEAALRGRSVLAFEPWPEYRHIPRDEILYPAQLLITSTISSRFRFGLSMPGPSILPLHKLLVEIYESHDAKALLSLVRIWTQSLGMWEFSEITLALMVGMFLQETCVSKSRLHTWASLTASSARHTTSASSDVHPVWAFREYYNSQSNKWLQEPVMLDMAPKIIHPIWPTSFAVNFHKFLRYWSHFDADAKHSIVSIRHDCANTLRVSRQAPYIGLGDAESPNDSQEHDVASREPSFWRYQPLIVQDPFIPTKNHAEQVSIGTLSNFVSQCRNAVSFLLKRYPLASIFGPRCRLPADDELRRSISNMHLWGVGSSGEEMQLRLSEAGQSSSASLAALPSQVPDKNTGVRAPDIAEILEVVPKFDEHPVVGCTKERVERVDTSSSEEQDPDHTFIHKLLQPSDSLLQRRSRTLELVQRTIRAKYGSRYTVELFGSIRYGVSLPSSDLDMIIIDAQRMQGNIPGHKKPLPPIYQMRKLSRVLHRAGFRLNMVIPDANVPLIKFADPRTGLSCDVNVNEQLGLRNSDLIKAYCDISPLLRPMLAIIKLWAKPLGLNDPNPARRGPITFSSYAFALMTIGFLQMRGLLPNLQENLPPLRLAAKEGIFWILKPKPFLCDTRYHRRIPGWERPQDIPSRKIMEDWFHYWRYAFPYSEQGMCIRNGGLISLETPQSSTISEALPDTIPPVKPSEFYKEWTSSPMCVVDPFIRYKNVTKSISHAGLEKFRVECERALQLLKDGKTLSHLQAQRGRS
ncbi:Poly(A) RNA polymerase cid11 [Hypsizygus marmoreus]|uniref:Poly(A) RNA polymerase cid11 n=1 Tax=Hypsizygus marmoreus TaxID=39966 RepID=A0A369K264_HYPMA|nr:Poly(A) RNA polymerase cid11 [Hypsizygus marmoreus]